MKDKIKNPLFEVISAMTNVTAPFYLKGKFYSNELEDAEYFFFQEWCAYHAKPYWATGTGIIDAADIIVGEAVKNGNIVG